MKQQLADKDSPTVAPADDHTPGHSCETCGHPLYPQIYNDCPLCHLREVSLAFGLYLGDDGWRCEQCDEARAELATVRKLLLDTLNQACSVDGGLWIKRGTVVIAGLSAYEDAADYLVRVGLLKQVDGNSHAFELAEKTGES